MKCQTALPDNYLNNLFNQWQNVLNRNELCSIISAPILGKDYRIRNFLEWQKANKYQQSRYIHLQVDLINHPEDIKIIFKNTNKTIIITPGKELLEKDNQSLLAALTHYKNKYNVGVLIFFEATQTTLEELASSIGPKLLQNLSFIPLLSQENTKHFCNHIALRWNIELSEKQIDQIYNYTGGHMWLIKESLRHLAKEEQLLSKIFSSREIQYKKEKIWQELPRTHREYLSKNVQTSSTIQRDLINLGFIISDTLEIPEFIQELSQNIQIDIEIRNSQIFFNNVNLTSFFNKKEQRILEAFYEAINNKVTRNKLASVIWQENTLGDYSDWALDKSISRFRTKLNSLGIPSSALITLREQGYQLLLSNK